MFLLLLSQKNEKEEREREFPKKLELRLVRTRSCNNPWSRTDSIKSDVSEVWRNKWTNKNSYYRINEKERNKQTKKGRKKERIKGKEQIKT